MNEKTYEIHEARNAPKETQSEDKTENSGSTFVTEQIIDFGRDGIRRRLVRRRMVPDSNAREA